MMKWKWIQIDKREKKMKNLMILSLILFLAVGCKSEAVEEAKAVEKVIEEVTE